jgi:hydrogenase-4 component E
MNFSISEMLSLGVALSAILLLGSTHLRSNIALYCLQVCLLCGVSATQGYERGEPHLYLIAAALLVLKAIGVPAFLYWIIRSVQVHRDTGTFLPAPLAMHVSLGFLVISYLLACELPMPPMRGLGWPGATASISLVCTGLLVMLTRRIALSQVLGFLVMENGIYLFGLTQTSGMPLLVEMGILLDVLVGVMIAGLIAFRIQKSFEHIDVTMLSELKD